MYTFFIGLTAILSKASLVTSHARLIQPAQRSSAWRFGYDNPANFNDHELFCGGFSVQWEQNNGLCGVCGDPYNAKVKPNEDVDGKYVKNGVITGNYVKGGVVEAEVDIKAYHKGWFEFRLCPLASTTEKVTQQCLDKTILKVRGTDTTRIQLEEYKTNLGPGIYKIDLQLPASVTCERCVLQWKYHTGNSWNCDADKCGIGFGPQENFVNCADIRITATGTTFNKSSSPASQSATMKTLTSSTTEKSPPSTTESTTSVVTTAEATTAEAIAKVPTTRYPSRETLRKCSKKMACMAVDSFSMIAGSLDWCCNNCLRDYCPSSHCVCVYLYR